MVSPSRKGLRNSVLSPYKRRSDPERDLLLRAHGAPGQHRQRRGQHGLHRAARERRMRLTILHAFLLSLSSRAAPPAPSPPRRDDPFAAADGTSRRRRSAALEAWNYNISHEELYGLTQGVTYGVRNGLVLRAGQRFVYVSQRAEDAVLSG